MKSLLTWDGDNTLIPFVLSGSKPLRNITVELLLEVLTLIWPDSFEQIFVLESDFWKQLRENLEPSLG